MDENQDDRHEDGRFKVGHKRLGGRALGALNKWSQAKDQWLETYALPLDVLDLTEEERALADSYGIDCAGNWQLYNLLKNDKIQYFKLGAAFAPRIKVQESRNLNVEADLSTIPTDALLRFLTEAELDDAAEDSG